MTADSTTYGYTLGPTAILTAKTVLTRHAVPWSFDGTCRPTSEAVASDPSGGSGAVSYMRDPVGKLGDRLDVPELDGGTVC